MDLRFGLLLVIFNFENDINGHYVVEVPGNSLEFFGRVGSQCGRNFNMMSSNVDLHVSLLFYDQRAGR